MTLYELQAIVNKLLDEGTPGSTPIVTRGSSPTTMVDADNVRYTKTKTRHVVYIGKPKAVTAD
jgi:hypothetical protein